MNGANRGDPNPASPAEDASSVDLLRPLLDAPTGSRPMPAPNGIVVGDLIGMASETRAPLVSYPGQPGSAAMAARSVVDLDAGHIGRQVVLMFEGGEPTRPIVMGVLRHRNDASPVPQEGQFELDVDGARLVVSAREQLVLRCGEASITLTRPGKVLIQGTYVSSRSTGVSRILAASVQIN
jgi:hypothetical protein